MRWSAKAKRINHCRKLLVNSAIWITGNLKCFIHYLGTVIPDRRPGLGPLAGIEAALRYGAERNAAAVFILAADLPHVGPEIVAAVTAGLIPESASAPPLAAAAIRRGEPDFEPLCAAYDIRCAQMATQLLDGGERAARALMEAVDGRKVALTPEEARTVSANVGS